LNLSDLKIAKETNIKNANPWWIPFKKHGKDHLLKINLQHNIQATEVT
jgi:hypothetical protein